MAFSVCSARPVASAHAPGQLLRLRAAQPQRSRRAAARTVASAEGGSGDAAPPPPPPGAAGPRGPALPLTLSSWAVAMVASSSQPEPCEGADGAAELPWAQRYKQQQVPPGIGWPGCL